MSSIVHLTEGDLARRWQVSIRTLQRWRWKQHGPRYLKLGGRVAYRLIDIEEWEQSRVRGPGRTNAH